MIFMDLSGKTALVAGTSGELGRVPAREMGPHGITVNRGAPGYTISDRGRANHTEVQPGDERIPLRRRGTEQEVANAVLFLASYITGAYLPVCGGNVMSTI